MMRAERLKGLAVIDLDAAEKIGTISDVILDPGARQVAGLIVAHGKTFVGGGHEFTLPASAVLALGHDAVTVRRAGADDAIGHLGGLPRLGQVTGRKVVTESGRPVGTIHDVDVDPQDGRIVGYPIGDRAAVGGLAGLLNPGDSSEDAVGDDIRADADLRVGSELVLVPDDAVVQAGHQAATAPTPLDAPAVDRLSGQPLLTRSAVDRLSNQPLPAGPDSPPIPASPAPAAPSVRWADPVARADRAPS